MPDEIFEMTFRRRVERGRVQDSDKAKQDREDPENTCNGGRDSKLYGNGEGVLSGKKPTQTCYQARRAESGDKASRETDPPAFSVYGTTHLVIHLR